MALYDFSYTKTDQGVIRTKSLFYELDHQSDACIFTLKEEAIEHPSGRPLMPIAQIFIAMAVDDPTEITFSDYIFGSWQVWDKIRNSDKRLVVHVEKWRKEADIRRKALAFSVVVNEVKNEGKSSFAAAKYLIEEGWNPKGQTVDARKKRSEARETAQTAFEREGLTEDMQRLKEAGLLPN